MDRRTPLKKNDRLSLPGMDCVIEETIGMGSNVIAYTGSYPDRQDPDLRHRVLIRELFPYDPQGRITRNPDGSINIRPSAHALYDFNRMTFQRGNEVHLRLAEKMPADLDIHINTFEYNNTLYSLVGYTGGRTLEKELVKIEPAADLLRMIRLIRGALIVLKSFHEAGYLHLDISPDNILLIGEGERERVTLIDYNSVHLISEIRDGRAVYYSTKEGYTAPEVLTGRIGQIGERTDLYSITAVLCRCLAGRRLSPVMMVDPASAVRSLMETKLLTECPETVRALFRRILLRGLVVTPRMRYQSAAQMLTDLDELVDRITGRGITHWALWEAGRARIRRMMEENTALDYIRRDDTIYPLFAETEEGDMLPVMETMRIPGPILLLGGGGMGKTTSLLRIAYMQESRYTADSPAVYFIPLYGYSGKDPDYICGRLLESLKFKPHTDSMETARRELFQLLDRRDLSFLLLLDGLNEARGDTGPLLEEIHRLADLSGVRMILTGRSDPGDPLFRKLTLTRLDQGEVRRILSGHGILPPGNVEVLDLLGFPLLLSMYIRTVLDGEKQLRLESRDQLLEDYFSAILEKEKQQLPDDQPAFLGIDAAVRFLLPEIAQRAQEKGGSLTGQEVFRLTEKCYKDLTGRAITAVRPEWLGHTVDLRLGAGNADEWYGRAVLEVLWKRLGLLVRGEQEDFRILHQVLEEYLAAENRSFHEAFDREKRRQRTWTGFLVMIALLLFSTAFGAYNYSMRTRLARQQKEILKNESEALAVSSAAKLAAGDREGALRDALSALPDDHENRPYVAAAEKALADPLYLYDSSAYRPSRILRWENDLVRYTMDDQGRVFAAVDEYGTIFCMDCGTGERIWESSLSDPSDSDRSFYDYVNTQDNPTEEYRFPVLRILEKSRTVFCAGERGEAVLLSLSDGRKLWQISYSDLPFSTYAYDPIQLADVSPDEKTLVLGILDRQTEYQAGEPAYPKYLLVCDAGSGEQLRQIPVLPEEAGMEYFTGRGVFSQDGRTYTAVIRNIDTDSHYLVPIDLMTGACGEAVRMRENQNGDDSIVTGIFRAEEASAPDAISKRDDPSESPAPASGTTGTRSGIWYYLCEYTPDYSRGGFRGEVKIGFLPDGAADWSFEKETSLIGDANRLPALFSIDGKLWLVSGNDLVCISQTGEETRISSEKKIIYVSREEKTAAGGSSSGEEELHLLFEDGSAGTLFIPGKTIWMDPDDRLGTQSRRMTRAAGSGRWKEPFCVFPESDYTNEAIYCEYSQTEPLKMIPDPLRPDDPYAGSGGCFVLPGGDRFLVLFTEDNKTLSEARSSYFVDVYGTLYSADAEILDTFTFTAPLFVESEELFFTQDGKKMLCGSGVRTCVYDLETHKVSSLEDALPEGVSSLYLRSAVTQEGILSAVWDGGRFYMDLDPDQNIERGLDPLNEQGSDQDPNRNKEGFVPVGMTGLDTDSMDFAFAEMSKDIEYEKAFDFDPMKVCSNGLVILAGTDGEKVAYRQLKGKPADYYLVYSSKEDRWNRIRNASSSKGFPAFCGAVNKPWFAAFDRDRRLLIYDADSGEVIRDWNVDLDILVLEEMSFVCGDRFIIFRSRTRGLTQYRMVRVSDGETVFTYSPGKPYIFGRTMLQEDPDRNRLYLYNGCSNMTGVCIDSESLHPLFEIPSLRCPLLNGSCVTYSAADEKYLQYPIPDRKEMIQKAWTTLRDRP